MRSVVVVLPASMWAMMPMLRSFWSGVDLGICSIQKARAPCSFLPAIVRESLVGFRHSVCVFLLLDRVAFVAARRDQLVGETLGHVLVAALTRVRCDPLHSERVAPLGTNLNRNLVRRTADAAALHFEHRLHVVER